jgi:hypothetical protein
LRAPKYQFDHPTQLAASTFLRAIATGDSATAWSALSRETRGLLEGLYAARANVALRVAAGVESSGADARLGEVVAPLRAAVLESLGGAGRVNGYGVSGARLVDRATAYVMLLPDFGDERVVDEAAWKPSHLIAFVHESREWLIDLARTADLSSQAGLPDPLGSARR